MAAVGLPIMIDGPEPRRRLRRKTLMPISQDAVVAVRGPNRVLPVDGPPGAVSPEPPARDERALCPDAIAHACGPSQMEYAEWKRLYDQLYVAMRRWVRWQSDDVRRIWDQQGLATKSQAPLTAEQVSALHETNKAPHHTERKTTTNEAPHSTNRQQARTPWTRHKPMRKPTNTHEIP